MPTKRHFLPCFIFLEPLKNNSSKSKLKHKTYSEILKKWDSQVIRWDTQISKELVLISFFYFKKRNCCIAWENYNFVNASFKR